MKTLTRILIGIAGMASLVPLANADSFSISYSQGYPAVTTHIAYTDYQPAYIAVRRNDRHEHDRGRGHRDHGRGHGYGHYDRGHGHGHHYRHHHYRPHYEHHSYPRHGQRHGHHDGGRIEGIYVNPRLFR